MHANNLNEDLRREILRYVKETHNSKNVELEKDVDDFLYQNKEKLDRWVSLLEHKQISKEEFELLLKSQKYLFVIKSLFRRGISKHTPRHFKNEI